MKVLVDTSVWVDFLNGHDSAEARTLARYIEDREDIATCGVVLAELFQGIRRKDALTALETYLLDMPLLTPREPDSYFSAAALYRALRQRGVTVRSTIDCLVVRLAEENDALVLAKDRDIRLILESGLARTQPAPLFS